MLLYIRVVVKFTRMKGAKMATEMKSNAWIYGVDLACEIDSSIRDIIKSMRKEQREINSVGDYCVIEYDVMVFEDLTNGMHRLFNEIFGLYPNEFTSTKNDPLNDINGLFEEFIDDCKAMGMDGLL